MCQFFESIKVENRKIFLADLHASRIQETYRTFGLEPKINLEKIFQSLDLREEGLFKLRISYDLDGNYRKNLIPYAVPEIKQFKFVINNDIRYALKYEDRAAIENMKRDDGEIIIIKDKQVTDTSFSNLLFLKGKEWYTPKTFLLNGVQRQNLIRTKKIKETEISVDNLPDFSHFQLINAMNDFNEKFVYPLSIIQNLKNYPDNDELN